MFGREKSLPCKVFEYGCMTPTAGEEIMIEQIKNRNQLWNKLVEIEHKHRAAVREILIVPDDNTAKLRDEINSLENEIKSRRKAERSGKVDVSDLKKKVKDLKNELAATRKKIKEKKKEVIEANRDRLDEIDKGRTNLVKEAQAASNLWWCNYDEVIANYNIARQRAMREGRELKFHRFDGTGKVTVRYQNGLPVSDVFGSDTRLQITPVPEDAWYHPKRSERRKLARTVVRIRIGSDGRAPVWFELPMIMHRPMPEDGKIRSASVVRDKVGDRSIYKLVVTVAFDPPKRKPEAGGSIGIDFGWRSIKEGLRVAYFYTEPSKNIELLKQGLASLEQKGCIKYNEFGDGGQLLLPERITSQFAKVDDLKSIRDKHLNDAKEVLSVWMGGKSLPDWLKEDTATLQQWRGKGRMVLLVRKWLENRFSGDQEIVAYLEEWVARDKHLWDWEANLYDQISRHRREVYRIFSSVIARTFEYVYIEDFNLSQVSEKPGPGDGTRGSTPADRQRTIASVSTLRQSLKNACDREGSFTDKVDSVRTTIECHVCGDIDKFDSAGHLMHTCPHCGQLWDQDRNAAINILRRGISQNMKQDVSGAD